MKHVDIVIITCFASNEPRAKCIQKYFENYGKTVLIISTDFIHRGKYYRKDLPEKILLVKTKAYKKNLSFMRLFSHFDFSRKALSFASIYSPELVYVMVPANSLAFFAARFKKKYSIPFIIDIVDLWPESLPCGKIKNWGPFLLWKQLRDQNLKYADLIITECDLYQKKLNLCSKNFPYQTVYWAQENETKYKYQFVEKDTQDVIQFFYLGSINNIIDMDGIIRFLNEIKKCRKIIIHIVGDGEKRHELLQFLASSNIPYNFYGYIYDAEKISRIAAKCHWGINMMKSTVEVGLTMKSVSYFQLGLPIINNIKGDTWNLIKEYDAGINIVENQNIFEAMSEKNINDLSKHAYSLFENLFSKEAFERQLSLALSLMDFQYQPP